MQSPWRETPASAVARIRQAREKAGQAHPVAQRLR